MGMPNAGPVRPLVVYLPQCPTWKWALLCITRNDNGPWSPRSRVPVVCALQNPHLGLSETVQIVGEKRGNFSLFSLTSLLYIYFSTNLLRDHPNQGCKANGHDGLRDAGCGGVGEAVGGMPYPELLTLSAYRDAGAVWPYSHFATRRKGRNPDVCVKCHF